MKPFYGKKSTQLVFVEGVWKNLQNEQEHGAKGSSSEQKRENLRVDSSAGWCTGSPEEQFFPVMMEQ